MSHRQDDVASLNARDATEWLRLARRGEMEAAWQLSDAIRTRTPRCSDGRVPRHLQQIWDGTPLDGRRVLIRCYHGLGDTIQFIRYVPKVAALAREVIVWAQPRLLPVLRTLPGDVRLLALHDGTPQADFDVDIEVMELPYAFRTGLTTIPVTVPYLDVTPTRLEHDGRLRVGIVWRAGDWDDSRSIPFDRLSGLMTVPGVCWYSLQHDVRQTEAHPQLQPLDNSTILITAEHMRALDLVISVDSMPAHLAGALGVATWILLPAHADWRWLEGRNDTPWYPTMKLFRQVRSGDWQAPLEEVRRGLVAECARNTHRQNSIAR
jgi:hypothetical protein